MNTKQEVPKPYLQAVATIAVGARRRTKRCSDSAKGRSKDGQIYSASPKDKSFVNNVCKLKSDGLFSYRLFYRKRRMHLASVRSNQ